MPTQKSSVRFYALMVLSLVGLAISIYLTLHFYQVRSGMAGFKSMCNFGSTMNCDVIAASKYAELIWGIPLSSFTTGWYLGLLAVLLFAMNANWRREGLRVAAAMTGFATVLGVIYFGLMASMGTYCLFCIGLDVVNVLMLALIFSIGGSELLKGPLNGAQWKPMLGTVAGCVFVAVVMLKGSDPSNYKASDVKLLVQEVISRQPLPITIDDKTISMGPKDAPVTIVEFSDFQCPYCRLGATTLKTLMNRYPKQVRVIFRNYPLDPACNRQMKHGGGHPAACEAARVATCANQQGKFEPVYEAIFENQEKLAPGIPPLLGVSHGLDEAQLKACLAAPETNQAVQSDIEEGIKLSVNSTPTFFINGRRIEGVLPLPAWSALVEALSAGK